MEVVALVTTILVIGFTLVAAYFLRKYFRYPRNLRKDIVVVFGGSGGIGFQIVEQMQKQGATTIIVDLRPPSKLPYGCKIFLSDIGTRASAQKVARDIVAQVGWPTVVINCVGIVHGKMFLDLSDAELEQTIHVNLLSHMWIAREFLPEMIRVNNGHLVTFGSSLGFIGTVQLADYCASKAALYSFNESLRMELRSKNAVNVRTTIVCPAFVSTDMFSGVRIRFPLLTPSLSPQYVAHRVVDAVTWGHEDEIWTPLFVYGVPILHLLPIWLYEYLKDLFGVTSAMNTFRKAT